MPLINHDSRDQLQIIALNELVEPDSVARVVDVFIDRYLMDKAIEKNKSNVKRNKKRYKKRQAIVEHPFGTIKRQWGYSYTLLKTIPKVQTEFSIIMLCYNLKRTIAILGSNKIKNALKKGFLPIFRTLSLPSASHFKLFRQLSYFVPLSYFIFNQINLFTYQQNKSVNYVPEEV